MMILRDCWKECSCGVNLSNITTRHHLLQKLPNQLIRHFCLFWIRLKKKTEMNAISCIYLCVLQHHQNQQFYFRMMTHQQTHDHKIQITILKRPNIVFRRLHLSYKSVPSHFQYRPVVFWGSQKHIFNFQRGLYAPTVTSKSFTLLIFPSLSSRK